MFLKNTFCRLFVLSAFGWHTGSAQTLFTYGNYGVDKQEFLKAYRKNNSDSVSGTLSYSDYLELYSRFKLKVRAALDEKMDTLQNQLSEAQAFRNQLADAYLKEDASLQLMIDEAFERSQKDIHLYDLFIRLPQNASTAETATAESTVNAAYAQLNQGQAFETIALRYNAAVEGMDNGDLGFISAFTLPYELENQAYSLTPGKFSKPLRAGAGYHILFNREERKAAGKLRIAQILVAFRPGFTDDDKMRARLRADSIYKALQEGASFSKLAASLSDDNHTFNTGGEMPAFDPGRYEPNFEKAAFGLANDSDVSQPVQTAYGYHILKRIQRIPVSANKTSKEWREVLKERVQQSDRMQVAQQLLVKKIHGLTRFKKNNIDEKELSEVTDSLLQRQPLPAFSKLGSSAPLFEIGGEPRTVNDFRNYLEGVMGVDDQITKKTRSRLYEDFIESASLDYFRNHLEFYNKDFADQLNEFREGNLLFEIMQKKVWDAASSDSVGLRQYYSEHQSKYIWGPSADALIISCPDKKTAEQARQILEKNYSAWRKIAEQLNAAIVIDSGRYELSQIPVLERTNFAEGLITAGVHNEQDNSVAFSYIIRLHKDQEPKKFEDARGSVINDYQNYLEEKWIAQLKSRYPVQIKKKTFKSLAGK